MAARTGDLDRPFDGTVTPSILTGGSFQERSFALDLRELGPSRPRKVAEDRRSGTLFNGRDKALGGLFPAGAWESRGFGGTDASDAFLVAVTASAVDPWSAFISFLSGLPSRNELRVRRMIPSLEEAEVSRISDRSRS